MKRLRQFMIFAGIMVGLIPMFLFYTQHTYYGAGFSRITSSICILCFAIAAIMRFFMMKKQGITAVNALIVAAGFIFLLIYVNFIM